MSKKTNKSEEVANEATVASTSNTNAKKRKRNNNNKKAKTTNEASSEAVTETVAKVATEVVSEQHISEEPTSTLDNVVVLEVTNDAPIDNTDVDQEAQPNEEKPFDFNSLPDEFFNRYYIYHGHGVSINDAHRIATPESIARLLADPEFVNEYLNDPDMSLQGETPTIDVEAIAFDRNKQLLKEGLKTLPLRRTYAAKYGRDGKLYMACVEFNLETEPRSHQVKYIDPKNGAERSTSIPNSPTKAKGIALAIEKLHKMLAENLAENKENLFSKHFEACDDNKSAAVELPYTKLLIDVAYLNEDGTVDELPGEHFLKCAKIGRAHV